MLAASVTIPSQEPKEAGVQFHVTIMLNIIIFIQVQIPKLCEHQTRFYTSRVTGFSMISVFIVNLLYVQGVFLQRPL